MQDCKRLHTSDTAEWYQPLYDTAEVYFGISSNEWWDSSKATKDNVGVARLYSQHCDLATG